MDASLEQHALGPSERVDRLPPGCKTLNTLLGNELYVLTKVPRELNPILDVGV